jgi:hypothetical protein
MTTTLQIARFEASGQAAIDAREIARRVELFEDRPEAVLTWSDVARYARFQFRRIAGPLGRGRPH